MLKDDNTSHGMHVTVNGHGQVSLWDSRDAAMRIAESGTEQYLWLTLTSTQRALIVAAATRQRRINEGTHQ